MASETLIYAIFAIVELIVQSAISDVQLKNSENRVARETQVRKFYQAARDVYGVSQSKLIDHAEKLGIQLNDLSNAARGSARLSRASKAYRDFVKDYPSAISRINSAKNQIQDAINLMNSKESEKASRIQTRGSVSNQEILQDINEGNQIVNSAVGGLTEGTIDTPRTGNIETSLRNNPDSESKGTGSTAIDNFIDKHKEDQSYKDLHDLMDNRGGGNLKTKGVA